MINVKGAEALTENELSQLFYLNKETERLQKDLRELEYYNGYKAPVITDIPKGNQYKDKIADYVAEVTDLREIIKLNLQKIQHERSRLERYISGIDNAEIRLIFRLRHINGMKWEDIATEIGYVGQYSESTVRKKHSRHLRKVSDISDSVCDNIAS